MKKVLYSLLITTLCFVSCTESGDFACSETTEFASHKLTTESITNIFSVSEDDIPAGYTGYVDHYMTVTKRYQINAGNGINDNTFYWLDYRMHYVYSQHTFNRIGKIYYDFRKI